MQQEDIRVRCTQCGDAHMESERPRRSDEELQKKNSTPHVCPKCGHDVWSPA